MSLLNWPTIVFDVAIAFMVYAVRLSRLRVVSLAVKTMWFGGYSFRRQICQSHVQCAWRVMVLTGRLLRST